MPYVSIMQIIDSQMRAFTSLFDFPIWFSMTPSPHRGSTLTYPAWPRTRDVWPGAPSFEHRVCSPSSVRAQRQKPFPPLVAEAARGRDRGSPPLEQGCEARSRCRNLLGRDRYRPPVQFSCGDSLAQCSRPRPGSWCLVRIRGMHAAKPAPIMHCRRQRKNTSPIALLVVGSGADVTAPSAFARVRPVPFGASCRRPACTEWSMIIL
jgi:hypothetical protein